MHERDNRQARVEAAPTGAGAGSSAVQRSANPVRSQLLNASGLAAQNAILAPVQLQGGGKSSTDAVHSTAQTGVAGGGAALPHLEAVQARFGRHDISGVSAHTDAGAAQACDALGADAYATGSSVAFKGAPSLHTAAHEAAHVVQQRAGVQLKGGVGSAGDRYEQHADQVADAVVAGQSAEGLLSEMAPSTAPAGAPASVAVQGEWRNDGSGQILSDDDYIARFGELPHPGWTQLPAPGTAQVGPQIPLTTAQRNALHTLLSLRLSMAYTKYANACQEVEDALQAERAARVELVMTLLGVGVIFVTPGLARGITSVVNQLPASASITAHRAALAIQGQAGSIASAIGLVGKTAAKPAVSAALSANADGYLDALNQGFSLAIDTIAGHVTANIENRTALSDADLLLYVANWDPTGITQQGYEQVLTTNARSFGRQVQPIGTPAVPEMGGATNLGRDASGSWHLYESYSRGRHTRRTAVSPRMLEGALHRSFAEFGGPWNMQFVGEEIISGGEMARMYRHGDHAPLRREFQQYRAS